MELPGVGPFTGRETLHRFRIGVDAEAMGAASWDYGVVA